MIKVKHRLQASVTQRPLWKSSSASSTHPYHSKLNTIFPLSEKQLNTHLADAELIEVSYENRDSGTKKLYTKKSSLPNRKRMMVIDIERAQAYMEENSNN